MLPFILRRDLPVQLVTFRLSSDLGQKRTPDRCPVLTGRPIPNVPEYATRGFKCFNRIPVFMLCHVRPPFTLSLRYQKRMATDCLQKIDEKMQAAKLETES